jgi:hypothetical protein
MKDKKIKVDAYYEIKTEGFLFLFESPCCKKVYELDLENMKCCGNCVHRKREPHSYGSSVTEWCSLIDYEDDNVYSDENCDKWQFNNNMRRGR